jgi:hypothetical protein
MTNANFTVRCISPNLRRFKKLSHFKSSSTMKKIGLLLFLLFPSTIAFSQSETQDFERLDFEKVMSDIDTIRNEIDSTFYYINSTYKILKEEVELFGCKKQYR